MSKKLVFKVKVYYEDTDLGGVVYYANYLKFIERARTEAIKSFGLSNNKLIKEHGIYIIVKSCNIEFKKPAKLEDVLTIYSSIIYLSKISFKMSQEIKNNNKFIASAQVHLVTVNNKGKPTRIPEILKKKLDLHQFK